MQLNGLHLLLTYKCTLECDHCFVWGSPWQEGVMTLSQVDGYLQQALETGSVKSIYFEGGEPFLYYSLLLESVRRAAAYGFEVGIVSNAYWATTVEDAVACLRPFAGLVQDLSVSSDGFHYASEVQHLSKNAQRAAASLGIPAGTICIQPPGTAGETNLMYRGRAASKLAPSAPQHPWDTFTACPHEDLQDPGRMHVDPQGWVHICQGITIGNMQVTPLEEICRTYTPHSHPLTGTILADGPAGLVRRHDLPHRPAYADACHLCDDARRQLRSRYPEILQPDAIYGMAG